MSDSPLNPTRTSDTTRPVAKEKIVILGGGIGAMTAAFYLTSQPHWHDRYEITVYEKTRRLGGKCASGRRSVPGQGQRIEEHGLHLWFGFNHNAFRMMEECYKDYKPEYKRDKKLHPKWIEDNFLETDSITYEERADGKKLPPWIVDFPRNSRRPGHRARFLHPGVALQITLDAVARATGRASSARRDRLVKPNHKQDLTSVGQKLRRRTRDLVEFAVAAESLLAETSVSVALQMMEKLSAWLDDPQKHTIDVLTLGASLRNVIRKELIEKEKDGEDDEDVYERRAWIEVDLWTTIALGMVKDRVPLYGFDSIDHWEFTEWLEHHGASKKTVKSAWVSAVYALVFGYSRGNLGKPDVAAGTALRGILNMVLGYNGSIMYKMKAGMGDVIFTPLYEVLSKRGVEFKSPHDVKKPGVEFKFQHAVKKLRVSPAPPGSGPGHKPPNRLRPLRIESIEISDQRGVPAASQTPETPPTEAQGSNDSASGSQAASQPGETSQHAQASASQRPKYLPPLIDVKDRGCWPSDPLQPTSTPTSPGSFTLTRGKDFDYVILGISLGALPTICDDLAKSNRQWKAMLDLVHGASTNASGSAATVDNPTPAASTNLPNTVATVSCQLWLQNPEVDPGYKGAIVVRGTEELSTWADMSHLLEEEDWPKALPATETADESNPTMAASQVPTSLWYLCGVVKADDREPIQDKVRNLLKARNGDLLQKGGNWDWTHLFDPNKGHGENRLSAQFFRTNDQGSELYVLSRHGTTKHRLPSDNSGFSNLFLAGDWTYTGINGGCVEAAVMSGMRAARAICGSPEIIIGEDGN